MGKKSVKMDVIVSLVLCKFISGVQNIRTDSDAGSGLQTDVFVYSKC